MVFDYDSLYNTEKKYVITYKDLTGKECLIEGKATSKLNAEILFRRKFTPGCEIIKVQTSDEWINEKGTEIAKEIMKHVKDLSTIVGDE